MILLTALVFIIIFSVLVLVHEWGHFTMARRAGIKVEEFGIGLPPRAKALAKDKEGTVYSLNWIPFGGYVRLFGEDSSDPKILKDPKSFASKSILQRTSVIVAGVVMNFFLAWVLITIGFMVGMKPFLVTQDDIAKGIESGLITAESVYLIQEIEEGSAFVGTDVLAGDVITEVAGEPVSPQMVLSDLIEPSQAIELTIEREGEVSVIEVVSSEEGRLGVLISQQDMIQDVQEVRYPIYEAPIVAIREVGRLSVLTVDMLGQVVVNLVSKFTVPDGVAGPVGIARMTHYFTQQGIMALMQFTALLSISLGVINIMPFPALDGGRFLFILFEIVLRKRPSAKWEAIAHTVGFVLLMLLILIITWNDIVNLMA